MNQTTTTPELEFDRDYAAEQLRRSQHPLRRFIKGFYLRNMLRDVRGPSVDFGCGAGQLLRRMPPGSVGLEVNPHLIEALRATGLTVHQSQASMQDFELAGLKPGSYRTLVIAHVMEHLPDPVAAMHVLLQSCHRLGIERVIVVVPGAKGFASDRTHKTFITRAFIESKLPKQTDGFVRSSISYFPGPWEWIGKYFVFHEMKIVFDRVA
jgi:trans-aconitate methyltransferase